MALIKCPECGKEISDKAVSCPSCGFPMENYVIDNTGSDVFETQEKCFLNNEPYELHITNHNEEILFKYEILTINHITDNIENFTLSHLAFPMNIEIYMIINHKDRGLCGRFEVLKTNKNYDKFCTLAEIMKKNNIYSEVGAHKALYGFQSTDKIKRQEEANEFKEKRKELKRKHVVFCPKCLSIDVEYIGTTNWGATEPKTKTVTKLNINPFKPLTVFDSKEKIVKKGSDGIDIQHWHCRNCGSNFKR